MFRVRYKQYTHGLVYFIQDKVITFLSNRVKESKLNLLIFVDFRSCLQCRHFWVAAMLYETVAWFNTQSSVNLTGKEQTQLG